MQVIVDRHENLLRKKRKRMMVVALKVLRRHQRGYLCGKQTEMPLGSRKTRIGTDTKWEKVLSTPTDEGTTTMATTRPRRGPLRRPILPDTTNIPTETSKIATTKTAKIITHTLTMILSHNPVDGIRTTIRRPGDGPTAIGEDTRDKGTGRQSRNMSRPTGKTDRSLKITVERVLAATIRVKSNLLTIRRFRGCTLDAKLDDCQTFLKIHISNYPFYLVSSSISLC